MQATDDTLSAAEPTPFATLGQWVTTLICHYAFGVIHCHQVIYSRSLRSASSPQSGISDKWVPSCASLPFVIICHYSVFTI
jgi:hypothetical protein